MYYRLFALIALGLLLSLVIKSNNIHDLYFKQKHFTLWAKLVIRYLLFFMGSSVEHITHKLMLLSSLWALNCILLTKAYLTKHCLDVEFIRRMEVRKVQSKDPIK